MADEFDVEYNDSGKIVDFLSGNLLEPRPEEIVRQRYLRILHHEYRYPKDRMRTEVAVHHGHKELVDGAGRPVRADIVIYSDASAARKNDQGKFFLVVECKAPNQTAGHNQLASYIYNTSATGGVWFNDSGDDDEVIYFRRVHEPNNELVAWVGIPRANENWSALGRNPKTTLVRPKDIKGLLRRCHNRLHGRGTDGDESDLTMDMVRIILAKAMDEEQSDTLPDFFCTPEEYRTSAGHDAVFSRISLLFDKVKRSNSDVFSEEERIGVSPRALADVVVELQRYQLISPLDSAVEWDIMGHAYEQYTSVHLKRERGQFFTNRLIIDMMVAMVSPDYQDIILDPAGGSGGFLTGAMRFVRNQILDGSGTDTAKSRQLDRHRTNLFMVESTKRLVRVAKTAMILNGDGHSGMTAGDSLGEYKSFDQSIIARAGEGKPTMILTNPPFAGVGEGRISDDATLSRFATGRRWVEGEGGAYGPTEDLLKEGAPPELLFFERCLEWLAPGGKLAIVLPKSFLDTATYRPGRELLFRKAKLIAVINCHKDTFQPHTGVRTCVIICQKNRDQTPLPRDYPVFMAISRRAGQDSEGVPIYKRDPLNNVTDEIDEDATEILEHFRFFEQGTLVPSQYSFSIDTAKIDRELRINPQRFLPHLNKTLEEIEGIDGIEGWSALPLDQIDPNIRVFKGPRLKSEDLIVSDRRSGVEPYYTPSAMLQEKSDSVKYIVISRASKKQLATIDAIRVQEGDIVISRSGTIGRVAIITEKHHNAIVSDDMIRVRTKDALVRNYLFGFLQSKFAQDQMLLNEYGAVQQHVEPQHVRDILVPWPDDKSKLETIVKSAGEAIKIRAALDAANKTLATETSQLVNDLVKTSSMQQPDGQ
jgi:type I restriction enzyme M protein